MANTLSKAEVEKRYEELKAKYISLGTAIKEALRTFLDKSGIDVLDVAYRIKTFGSFWDKVERKGYKRPFSQIEDICGIRIVCFYPSDLDRISQILNKEFIVKESEDKSNMLEPDRFGYRSLHYIVILKKEWLDAPQYRGLGNLKVEIQTRTILMHAWADLSHKLSYKKKEDVPDQFKRKIYQLSALFEVADQQFDTLQREKINFQRQLSKRSSKKSRFDTNQPMNVDTLQAFLDFYFPDRERSSSTGWVLDGLIKYGMTFDQLVDAYERTKDILPHIEQDYFKEYKDLYPNKKKWWTQDAMAKVILYMANDTYWKGEQPHISRDRVSKFKKAREILKEHK